MAENKDSLLVKFKKQIDENIKKGAKTSKDLRIGIPSKFIASDGKEYRLQNVSRYFRTGENPTFLDVALNKEVKAARANALKIQTSPNVEKWDSTIDAVKGTEAHHKRMVKMYAPFYEGLDEKQAKELTQWFVDEGVPLGDAKSNLKNLSPKVHKEIHKWMQENNIQVRPDKTGKGNFVTLDKGPYKGTKFVRGSVDGGVKAVMPSFKELPINARFPLIANWLNYVQDPIDTKLSELEWDEYRSKHPIKPRDAAQIPEIAKELAEEKKLNYADYPEWQKDEVVIGGNGTNGTNGTNGIKKPGSKINLKKLGLGAAALTIGSNFLPSKVAAEEIRDEVSQGEIGDATKTYAKDLLIGHTASRSLGSILKLAKSKLSGNIAKKVIGRQLLKKGAALATGPAAPIVMGSLLIKDAYDVANVISGDKLKIRENKDMSNDERKRSVERLKFIK